MKNKNKIIKCEYCGYESKVQKMLYMLLVLDKGELYYEQKDAEAWEFGQYVCGSCYSELPIHTEHEMVKYLKSISMKK